jgi:hypothetical protein
MKAAKSGSHSWDSSPDFGMKFVEIILNFTYFIKIGLINYWQDFCMNIESGVL